MTDGIRTRDFQNHNLGSNQLSYSHHLPAHFSLAVLAPRSTGTNRTLFMPLWHAACTIL